MAMDHTLKEKFIAHVRSGRYRVCQYHLARKGIGGIRETSPLATLVEVAGIAYEWRECGLPGHEPHPAMYVLGDYETLTDNTLTQLGLSREQHELAGFRTLPDSVIDELGITRKQVEELRSMSDGGYKEGATTRRTDDRVFPATMNQMADWIHRNIKTQGQEDPSKEGGPADDWENLPLSATTGNPDAAHDSFSAIGGAKPKRSSKTRNSA